MVRGEQGEGRSSPEGGLRRWQVGRKDGPPEDGGLGEPLLTPISEALGKLHLPGPGRRAWMGGRARPARLRFGKTTTAHARRHALENGVRAARDRPALTRAYVGTGDVR